MCSLCIFTTLTNRGYKFCRHRDVRSDRCSFRFFRGIDLHVCKDWNHTCWHLFIRWKYVVQIYITFLYLYLWKYANWMCLLYGFLLCSDNTCLEAEITNYMHELNLSKYIKLYRNYLTANQHFEHIVCLLSMCISGPYGEGEEVLGVWGKTL